VATNASGTGECSPVAEIPPQEGAIVPIVEERRLLAGQRWRQATGMHAHQVAAADATPDVSHVVEAVQPAVPREQCRVHRPGRHAHLI